MLLGVRPGFLEAYHTELAILRLSQCYLRADAVTVTCLTQVKHDLKQEIADLTKQLRNALRGSPNSGAQAQLQAQIVQKEKELARYSALIVAPSAHLPRGIVARIALHMLGGTAANYVSDVMRGQDGCPEMANLAVCQLCSICLCHRHRFLVGNVGYDKDGRALGGVHCQCRDVTTCRVNQTRVMRFLQVPADAARFQPAGNPGSSKGKGHTGKRKDYDGNGKGTGSKSKRRASSSSALYQ